MGTHEPATPCRGGGGGRGGTSLRGRERDALAQGKPEQVTTSNVTYSGNHTVYLDRDFKSKI